MRRFLTCVTTSCLLIFACTNALADVLPLPGIIVMGILMSQNVALQLTLIIETAVVMTAARHWQVSWRRGLAAGIVPTMLTHPPAWWILEETDRYWLYFIVLEVVITLIESTVLKKILRVSWRQALLLSLWANAASALVGVFL